jgi:hypothetical protein
MDKRICSNHLTVRSDDDVPFAGERHRCLPLPSLMAFLKEL